MSRKTVEKSYTIDKEEKTVYFREQTGADTRKLLQGQMADLDEAGKVKTRIDFGSEYDRNLLRVQLTLCTDSSGETRTYQNANQVLNLPQSDLGHLIRLALEAEKAFAERAGNGS